MQDVGVMTGLVQAPDDGLQDGVTKASLIGMVEYNGDLHIVCFIQSSPGQKGHTITIVKKPEGPFYS
jgi:hypothetical protein